MPDLGVPVRTETLKWALDRARLDAEYLAKAGGTSPNKARAWLEGRARLTYRQAMVISQKLYVSFGQLLIPPPDRVELPIPDLRRGSSAQSEPSPNLLDTIYDALRKRDWWREYRRESTLPFVGSFRLEEASHEDVAEGIRRLIPVQTLQERAPTWTDFLRKLSVASEGIGILVLRKGVVGSNPHRQLDPDEFSGFAIADPVAPVIVINTKDYVARCNFTFAHELAHIWLGQDALDDSLENATQNRLEHFCDQVAAALLTPSEAFQRVWHGEPGEAVHEAARYFKVSVWVAARRALELQLVSKGTYEEILNNYYKDSPKQKAPSSDGGSFHLNVEVRNNPAFTHAVAEAALQGEITFAEAASLLGLSLRGLLAYLEKRSHGLSA